MLSQCKHILRAAAVAVAAAPAIGGAPPLELADPAPPAVREPSEAGPKRSPRRHPRVELLARPRPLAEGAVTEDWPCFLGPRHRPVSAETKLRKEFAAAAANAPPGPRLLWQMAMGEGYAAPAVADGRLVVFHRLGDAEVVECLSPETGRLHWQHRYPTRYRDRFNYNGGPRATPTIAGGKVYTHGAEGRLHCLDLAGGDVLWQRDLRREFRTRPSFFGAGCSPLVEGGRVILNIGGDLLDGGGPSVIALDANTGRLAWAAERRWGAGYAGCVPATVHARRVVFVFAGGESDPPTGGLICLDAATGATHFRFPFRSKRVASVNASSPVVVGRRVFLSSIYDIGGAMLGIRADMTAELLGRTKRFASHWMTPIPLAGHLYGFADATLGCLEIASCRRAWSCRPSWPLPGRGGATARVGRASLLRADGAFLCLGEYGDLAWLELTPDGAKVLSAAKLFHARQTWTCPVISRGLLYVCQNAPDRSAGTGPRLLCYDLRGR